jgi:hypothetical protein
MISAGISSKTGLILSYFLGTPASLFTLGLTSSLISSSSSSGFSTMISESTMSYSCSSSSIGSDLNMSVTRLDSSLSLILTSIVE